MRILVWGIGAGVIAISDTLETGDIIGYIDTFSEKRTFLEKPVYRPDDIPGDFDAIVVTTRNGKDVYDDCIKLGIDLSKVIFFLGNGCIKDLNVNYELTERLFGGSRTR